MTGGTRSTTLHLAIDLGAGSGRAFAGRVGASRLDVEEVHRFHYNPRPATGRLRWDAARLFEGVTTALARAGARAAATAETLESVGVDSWGVDYGLLDAHGVLIEEPVSYRDPRTAGVMEEVFRRVPRAEVFARTGVQCMPLNTLFQLAAHAASGIPKHAARLLFIPDLCHHLLCGSQASERTDASTSQLLSAVTGNWDEFLFERLSLPRMLMPPLVATGTPLGALRARFAALPGLAGVRAVAPATHDTASAVAAIPLDDGTAFISSGTWSLVGVERRAPLLSDEAARANFTNEVGAFGTVCFMKNVTGLWLLDGCRKEWEAGGVPIKWRDLATAAATVQDAAGFIFPDDARFFNPPSMVREIRAALRENGQEAADDPARLARVILDSLALRYASVVEDIERVTGHAIRRLHVVGGGSLNAYLNQATANATGRVVEAGPAEATAAGNLLVQAIAAGTLESLQDARALVGRTIRTDVFEPRNARAWEQARDRYREIERG